MLCDAFCLTNIFVMCVDDKHGGNCNSEKTKKNASEKQQKKKKTEVTSSGNA